MIDTVNKQTQGDLTKKIAKCIGTIGYIIQENQKKQHTVDR